MHFIFHNYRDPYLFLVLQTRFTQMRMYQQSGWLWICDVTGYGEEDRSGSICQASWAGCTRQLFLIRRPRKGAQQLNWVALIPRSGMIGFVHSPPVDALYLLPIREPHARPSQSRLSRLPASHVGTVSLRCGRRERRAGRSRRATCGRPGHEAQPKAAGLCLLTPYYIAMM